MNRLTALVLALAASSTLATGRLYWNSPEMLPLKVALERSTVVKVTTPDGGFGSGVRVRTNAVVTCAHVAESATVEIEYLDGSHETGVVVLKNEKDDLAVILVKAATGRIAKLGGEVAVGESVVAIGHPGGIAWNTTLGIVSCINEIGIISDTVINGGNSGGGLFNSATELVGIARAIVGPAQLRAFQGHSVFIPAFKVRAILKKYDRLSKEGRLGQEIEAGNVR